MGTCKNCGCIVDGFGAVHGTVERVVRPGEGYGYPPARAGERVVVKCHEAEHPSVQSATMSVEEWDALQQARTVPADPSAKGAVTLAVERDLASTQAAVRDSIERGRQTADEETDKPRKPPRVRSAHP